MKLGDKVYVTDIFGFVDVGTLVEYTDTGYQDLFLPGVVNQEFSLLGEDGSVAALFCDDEIEVME